MLRSPNGSAIIPANLAVDYILQSFESLDENLIHLKFCSEVFLIDAGNESLAFHRRFCESFNYRLLAPFF